MDSGLKNPELKLGFLYAGQGSQHPGMGADFYQENSVFREIFHRASFELDFDLKEVCFTDHQNLLNQTRYTQPCMVAFAVGLTEVLRERGIRPSVAAGLSLGEYSALYAAGVLDEQTVIRTVAFRGQAMERASQGIESAMFAVFNLDRDSLESVCQEVEAEGAGIVVISNYNCPGQLVIGGKKAAVKRAAELAKEKGARRCLPLKVSGPFHTPLMAPAGKELKEYFRDILFSELKIPVIFNCLGKSKPDDITIPELLVRQVQSSIDIEGSIRTMAGMGLDAMIEIGPGKALSGFVRKTVPEMPVYAIETVADLEQLSDWLIALEKKEKRS